MTTTFNPEMLLAILPELGLLVLVIVALVLDLVWRDRRCGRLALYTAVGTGLVMVLSLIFALPGAEPQLIFGGMLRLDAAAFVFRMLFLSGALLTSLLVMGDEALCVRGEFFVLLLVSTLGMSLMAGAADVMMLFLAIETASIPLYVLAGFYTSSARSVEAGIKYLLFGGLTSAVMLYGFSLLYGLSGTTRLYGMLERLQEQPGALLPALFAVILVLAGFGFKISAVPFHFWAPDVYEGSPTQVAGFLSTASKAAGFVVLLRVMTVLFPQAGPVWTVAIVVLALASMLAGNLLALAQKNVKRLLAYSSIAQAGYMLVGVAADSQLGTSGVVYYLMGYLVTNLAAFGVVHVVGQSLGSNDLSAYDGLSRRSPRLALLMLMALLSLGGVPPFAGFFGKLLVFGAAVEAGLWWLAMVGVLTSVLALYYYLNLLRRIYQEPMAHGQKLHISWPWKVALMVCGLGIVTLGVFYAPWYTWAERVATMFF